MKRAFDFLWSRRLAWRQRAVEFVRSISRGKRVQLALAVSVLAGAPLIRISVQITNHFQRTLENVKLQAADKDKSALEIKDDRILRDVLQNLVDRGDPMPQTLCRASAIATETGIGLRAKNAEDVKEATLTAGQTIRRIFEMTDERIAEERRGSDAPTTVALAYRFFWWDLAFIATYVTLFWLAILWARDKAKARVRARKEAVPRNDGPEVAPPGDSRSKWLDRMARIVGSAWPAGIAAIIATALADGIENIACVWALSDKDFGIGVLDMAHFGFVAKWLCLGVAASFSLAGVVLEIPEALSRAALKVPARKTKTARGPGGEPAAGAESGEGAGGKKGGLLQWGSDTWEHFNRAFHFAMKARFSVLGGLAIAVALLGTPPGQDIVRTLIFGSLDWDSKNRLLLPVSKGSLESLGYFLAAVLLLGATCWGWARLLLSLRFLRPGQRGYLREEDREENVEKRLRRELPAYLGSLPLVVSGCAFMAVLDRDQAGIAFAPTFFTETWLGPVLALLLLPFGMILLRRRWKDEAAGRSTALAWLLAAYAAWAVFKIATSWTDHRLDPSLRLAACLSPVLFAIAFFVFGLGRAGGVLLAPYALVVGAMATVADVPVMPALLLLALWLIARHVLLRRSLFEDLRVEGNLGPGEVIRIFFQGSLPKKPGGGDGVDDHPTLQMLLQWAAVMCGFHLALLVLFTSSGLGTAASLLGSGAILCLGIGAWVSAGSLLLTITQASRFPIISCAVLVAIGWSIVVDHHEVTLMPAANRAAEADPSAIKLTSRPRPVGDHFLKWLEAVPREDDSNPPCIIVATEGGGIRAAFWTATVLSTLQDASTAHEVKSSCGLMAPPPKDFASHVFAISGVSGGSVGAAFFTALCADKKANLRDHAAAMLGVDHLAPALGSMMYPDAFKLFLPVRIGADRAAALEHSWERAWERVAGTRRMSEPFLSLWRSKPVDPSPPKWLPALFLNGTLVEQGKRTICSNVPIHTGSGGEFIDAHDLHNHLRRQNRQGGNVWHDLPLSAAALSSARFPVISPPGRLPSGQRVVDGGYFENSGAATGLEILDAVMHRQSILKTANAGRPAESPELPVEFFEPPERLTELKARSASTQVIFVFLRFGTFPRLSDKPERPTTAVRAPSLTPDLDGYTDPPLRFLNDVTGIANTIMATRSARGSYSQDAIYNRYAAGSTSEMTVLSFDFTDPAGALPLSWSLSQRSCQDMLKQFPAGIPIRDSATADQPPGLRHDPDLDTPAERNGRIAAYLLEQIFLPGKSKSLTVEERRREISDLREDMRQRRERLQGKTAELGKIMDAKKKSGEESASVPAGKSP